MKITNGLKSCRGPSQGTIKGQLRHLLPWCWVSGLPAVAPLRTAARGLQSAELWYEPLLALMRTAERRVRSAEQPHEPPSTHHGGSAERGLRTAERGAIARASVGNVTLQRSMRTAECSTAVQAAPQKNFKKALTADCSRHSLRLRRCAVHRPPPLPFAFRKSEYSEENFEQSLL